jgi:hypothetical protein
MLHQLHIDLWSFSPNAQQILRSCAWLRHCNFFPEWQTNPGPQSPPKPGLAVPLYSLRTHITQQGCGFIGTCESGFLVYFPTFVLSVDTAIDCHLSFDPLGRSAPLATLHYVQPRCSPAVYPSEVSPSTSTAAPSPASPVMIEDDNVQTLPLAKHPILTSSAPSSAVSIHTLSTHIKSLTDAVNHLTSSSSHTPQPHSFPTPLALDVDEMTPADSDDTPASCLLSTMSSEEITRLLHHPGTSFPSIQPCDTANTSDQRSKSLSLNID